jgi:putative transposase
MDFVADNLFDGRELRMLTVLHCFTRESLAVHVGQSLKGKDVVRVVEANARRRGAPSSITTENNVSVSSLARRWTNGHASVAS